MDIGKSRSLHTIHNKVVPLRKAAYLQSDLHAWSVSSAHYDTPMHACHALPNSMHRSCVGC